MTSVFAPEVAAEVFDLRPDYTAICVIADGLVNAPEHPAVAAYAAATLAAREPPSWAGAHLESWRAAYRDFGAKPQRTPCSAEALMSRVTRDGRLPAINAVVDLYNAVSVRHAIPVGGEDIAAYVGMPRLLRAPAPLPFDTVKDGQPFLEEVPAGEVVWADDRGVTCRRWNWRQGTRTRIDLPTTRAWFVFERLEPMPLTAATGAALALMEVLRSMSPDARLTAHRIDRHTQEAIP